VTDGRRILLGWMANWIYAEEARRISHSLAVCSSQRTPTQEIAITTAAAAATFRSSVQTAVIAHRSPLTAVTSPSPRSPSRSQGSSPFLQVPTERWRSAMTLPRTLHLVHDGPTKRSPAGGAVRYVLASRPVREIASLRSGARRLHGARLQDWRAVDLKRDRDLGGDLGGAAGHLNPIGAFELELRLSQVEGSVGLELNNSRGEVRSRLHCRRAPAGPLFRHVASPRRVSTPVAGVPCGVRQQARPPVLGPVGGA
jgi:hypothetical protein